MMTCSRRYLLHAAVAAVLFFAVRPEAYAASATHASHRAFYEISIGRVDQGSSILDARGRMVTEWRRACEGWTTSQRLVVSMAPGEGEPIDSEVTLTSFENADGTEYVFDSETRIGGETVELVRGRAAREAPGKLGKVTYEEPAGLSLDLPADTVFPFEHTLVLLDAAERGDRRAFNHYFDGSQPEISPLASNALILGKPRDGADGQFAQFGELTARKWWPIRLAMFNGRVSHGGEEQPEFEMTQNLQDNGIVRSFEFDYGDFSLVASMVELEELDAPRCD